jgi:hypothetical protein
MAAELAMTNLFSIPRAAFAALALASLAGCGSGAYPACEAHKTTLTGTLDGAAYTKTLTNESTALSQLGSPATLQITFLESGHLDLQWSGAVADGQEADVTGELNLPSDGTRTVGAGSTLVVQGDGGYQLDLKLGGTDELFGCAN